MFEAEERVGCIFGELYAAPHDPDQGYIGQQHIPTALTIFSVRSFLQLPGTVDLGYGANMAVRAEVLDRIGGWDPCIGPGAKFGSGDDHDLSVRTLLAGCGVHYCPQARVCHYGLRYWHDLADELTRMGFGQGAAFAKYLRCGIISHGSLRILRIFSQQSMGRILRMRRPFGLAFPRGWFTGLAAGLRHPLEKATYRFQGVDSREIQRYGQQFAKIRLRSEQ